MTFAKKSLGQNFLADRQIAARIVGALGPRGGETIVEIGPGRGALTAPLLASGARLIAVEYDRDLVPLLRAEFAAAANFTIIESDALAVDYCELIGPATSARARVISNLPYNISTAVLQRLLEQRRCLAEMVLMLQREVVDRITAAPSTPDRGFLSVLVQTYCRTEPLFDVAPGAFRPAPKVWSRVIRLEPREQSGIADDRFFVKLLGAAFAQRRKTILNNLKRAADEVGARLLVAGGAVAALDAAGVEAGRRAETLTLEEWRRLARVLE